MLKLNLGLHFNLSKLSLLGFANLLFLPVLAVHPANGQLNELSYSCQSNSGRFATMGRSLLGARPIVTWENRQPICNTVSQRFEIARSNGNLRFLMNEGILVCGTNRDGGECLSPLFSTESVINPEGLWRRIMNGATIDSRYITQSGERGYFNIELYLQTVPVSTNQEISTNQLPSQP